MLINTRSRNPSTQARQKWMKTTSWPSSNQTTTTTEFIRSPGSDRSVQKKDDAVQGLSRFVSRPTLPATTQDQRALRDPCTTCFARYKTKDEHTCWYAKCGNCKEEDDLRVHRCYNQPVEEEKPPLFVYADIEAITLPDRTFQPNRLCYRTSQEKSWGSGRSLWTKRARPVPAILGSNPSTQSHQQTTPLRYFSWTRRTPYHRAAQERAAL